MMNLFTTMPKRCMQFGHVRPQLIRTVVSVRTTGYRTIEREPARLVVKKAFPHGGYRLKSSLPIPDEEDNVLPFHSENKKIIPFLLADIGEGIAEVEVLQWFVSPGDKVHQFDRICEVQSDKATVEITSRYDGVVESLSDKHDIVKVGSPLIHLYVEDEQEDNDPNPVEVAREENVGQDKMKAKESSNTKPMPSVVSVPLHNNLSPKVLATPAVRKLCMDYNLDLSKIDGSGPKGRVLKADILKSLRDSGILSSEEDNLGFSEEGKQSAPSSIPKSPQNDKKAAPIRGYNRIMAKTMTESLSIPHMCYSDEINMNAILSIRRNLPENKVSILAFAIKAASLSINDYPILNSSFDMDDMEVTYHSSHNIGVAMDTPNGLAVPVIKDCQNLSILEIGEELKRLKELATAGNLTKEDVTNATFSLSNIGAIGGTYMSPIVAKPQVAIGAMGKIQRLPRFTSEESLDVEEVRLMQISWGADHRVIDGATLARFSNRWKELIENPTILMFLLK